mmetsp:Transcript_22424/g.62728  ORF Transcript_22424/g.62728 Transcript_22424/m.62728 type:complete len:389 (+) Transcript_22424:2-1168(+)
MVVVADHTKFLGCYADLMGLVALLPLLTHMKFAKLLAVQRKGAVEKDASNITQHAAETTRNSLPPASALLLFVIAELCASIHLFDLTDSSVKRAVGELARVQKRSKSQGLAGALAAIEKVMDNVDVLEIIRFTAAFAGLIALLVTVFLRLDELDVAERGTHNPFKRFGNSVLHCLRQAASPRLLCLQLLLVTFVTGNWSVLRKFVQKSGTLELVRAAAGPLRAFGLSATVLQASYTGPMPLWAAAQGAAAAARAARIFVYERLSLAELSGGSVAGFLHHGSATLFQARCAMTMEALCFVLVFACALNNSRLGKLALPLLMAPAVIMLMEGPTADFVGPYMQDMTKKCSLSIGAFALMMVFMGGFGTMLACIAVVQAFSYIHRLEKMKF